MKKILFVITKSNWGGAQRYVFDLATSLSKNEFDVAVVIGGTGEKNSPPGKLAHELQVQNIRTIFVSELGRDISFKSDLNSYAALKELFERERPDIVHLNSSKVGGLGALAARRSRVPHIIFTAHGWPFWEKRNIVARGAIFFLSWLTVLLSHRTICISQFDKRHIRFMPFVRKKTMVIYNGIPSINFFSREEARDALFSNEVRNDHSADLWVVTNAELHPNKNIFLGIDAVARHNARRPQKLFYAIMGAGELHGPLTRYIEKRGLSKYVTLLGFIDDARRYLTAFDMFLLPSKKEGLPYVILEAGEAGLPTIASNVGGIPEIIEQNVSGILVPSGDTEGFVRALDTLSIKKDLREKFGTMLRQKVLNEFSLEHMLKETALLYRRES